jgi:hypothetical protein
MPTLGELLIVIVFVFVLIYVAMIDTSDQMRV